MKILSFSKFSNLKINESKKTVYKFEESDYSIIAEGLLGQSFEMDEESIEEQFKEDGIHYTGEFTEKSEKKALEIVKLFIKKCSSEGLDLDSLLNLRDEDSMDFNERCKILNGFGASLAVSMRQAADAFEDHSERLFHYKGDVGLLKKLDDLCSTKPFKYSFDCVHVNKEGLLEV